VNYLHGEISPTAFWSYFVVAFGVKSALGLLLVLAPRRRPSRDARTFRLPPRRAPRPGRVPLPVGDDDVLQHRHSPHAAGLPAAPARRRVVLARGFSQRAAVAALAGAALLQGAEVARVHPHEMSFFNALAGGPANGEAWLNDSNSTGGRTSGDFRSRFGAEGRDAGLTVAYFGGADPRTTSRTRGSSTPRRAGVLPGLYAVSFVPRCCGPETMAFHLRPQAAAGYESLRRALAERGEAVGRVGYSIGLYRIRENADLKR